MGCDYSGPPGGDVPHEHETRFDSGAVRQKLDDVRYDLISPFGLQRLAATCAGGAKKYGDHNWRKGMPFSVLLNHVLNHLTLYLAGENGEDHLAHAAWGLFAMMEFEETMPWMNDLYDYGDEVHLDDEEEEEEPAEDGRPCLGLFNLPDGLEPA